MADVKLTRLTRADLRALSDFADRAQCSLDDAATALLSAHLVLMQECGALVDGAPKPSVSLGGGGRSC